MEAVALTLALGLMWLHWEAQPRLSPDGHYYWGPAPPRPYGMRLLPALLPASMPVWRVVSGVAVAGTAALVGWQGGWVAAALWLGLSSTRTNTWLPVLTDQVGQLLMVLAMVLPWPWNLGAALLGGCANEKAPVFAAALMMDPWLLLGLLPAGVMWTLAEAPGAKDPAWLRHPVQEARKVAPALDWQQGLWPWGVALVGLGTIPVLALALAYGQLAMAQDRARLYQWVGPAVCVGAAGLLQQWVPGALLMPLVLAHWLSPGRKVL